MESLFPWREVVGVALGGACGSLVRYGVGVLFARASTTPFPLAILLINVTGCFLIGMLGQWCEPPSSVPAWLRVALGAGFLGGLTTFSTFGYDTFRLMATSEWPLAALNIAANVVLGLLAVGTGMQVMRLLTT